MSELPASNEQLSRLARSDQYLGKDRDQLREIILDRDEEIAQLSDALQDAREVNYESEVAGLVAENKRLQGAFKNFHRLLCERFGCAHDEKDWERDQLSLIEWIAKRYSRDETTVEQAHKHYQPQIDDQIAENNRLRKALDQLRAPEFDDQSARFNRITKILYLPSSPEEPTAKPFGLCPKHKQLVEIGCLDCEALAGSPGGPSDG